MAPLQELLRHLAERDAAERPTPTADVRTGYGIRSSVTDLWIGENFHWVPREHARQFEFMTSANAYAIGMGYEIQSFTVEAV
jgi:hypothetical protein